MNVYDSQRMADTLAPEGYVETTTAEDADLIILNTCHIREKAAEKVYSELGRMRRLKETAAADGRKPLIAVAGCVAQAEGAEIIRRAPAVDLVLVGDLFYDAALAARVTAVLDRCRLAGVVALVGDPWRAPLPRARLERLAEYRLADFGDAPDAAATASAVFAFV